MRQFILTLETDGQTFDAPLTEQEIARILRDTADRLVRHVDFKATQILRDSNGNHVGRAVLVGHEAK